MYEEELKRRSIPHETYIRPLEHVDRYKCEGEEVRYAFTLFCVYASNTDATVTMAVALDCNCDCGGGTPL